MTRPAPPGDRRDAGLTLVELMVTLVVLGIVGATTLTTVVAVSRAVVDNRARSESLALASVGMANMTRALRAGVFIPVTVGTTEYDTAFRRAGPRDVVFTANLTYPDAGICPGVTGDPPILIRYYVDADRVLREDRWCPTSTAAPWTFPTVTSTTERGPSQPTPVRSRVIASQIPAGTTVFQYSYFRNDAVQPETDCTRVSGPAETIWTCRPVAAGTTSTDLSKLERIKVVAITLVVDAQPQLDVDPVRLENTVTLVNDQDPR